MNTSIFKKILPHLIAIALFMGLTMVYLSPALKGKELKRHDFTVWKSTAQEANEFKKQTGETTLWSNSSFSGMPMYLTSPTRDVIFAYVHKALTIWKNENMSQVFLYLIGFYIALMVFGLSPWLAIAGAIAFAFSSYFFIIIQAGHGTKAFAIGFMAPILAGFYMALNKKPLLGSLIMALFLTLQIRANHFQITYYTLIAIFILGIVWLYNTIKEKQLLELWKPIAFGTAGVLLAVGVNLTSIYTTYEYGNYSIRGASELTHNKSNQTSGLDKDYATAWSYGIDETFTLLIPNFKGGASAGSLDEDSEMYKLFEGAQGKAAARNVVKQLPLYFGSQPMTSGPVYVGAIVCFLFVLGLFVLRGPIRTWLVAITVVSIVLSWGRNLTTVDFVKFGLFAAGLLIALKATCAKADKKAQKRYLITAAIVAVSGIILAAILPTSVGNNPLSYYVLDYLPGYNKFRTVSMTLVIAEFAMPLMGILALAKVLSDEIEKERIMRSVYWSVGITAGLSLFIGLFSGMFNFAAPSDAGMQPVITDALQADRQMLLKSDAFRSFGFILAAALLLVAVVYQKIKLNYFYAALIILLLLDMWPINKRYLNDSHFVTQKQFTDSFNPTKADQYILKDADPNFKVLNLSVSTFNDATTSHYHKSIGGYHGAKMRRYQELIDFHLSKEIQNIANKLNDKSSAQDVYSVIAENKVLNMLNTKYVILNPESFPVLNTGALGNAWFVTNINKVQNADEEINALYTFNPKTDAVIDNRFADLVKNFRPQADTTASIKMTIYKPNYLKYESMSNTDQLAIFSEIYYPKGWIVTIDGKPAEHFRADYVLRGMIVPKGKHTIEYKFQPRSVGVCNTISMASSIILILGALGYVVLQIRRKKELA